MEIKDDDLSIAGKKEELTEIQINTTVPTWNSSLLEVPPRILEYGLHKLVYRVEVETFNDDFEMLREAFTYLNITKSPLQLVLMEGAIARVTRGWGQELELNPYELSVDPDNPEDKVAKCNQSY